MKYIFLLLLFPLFVISEEENQVTTNEIDRIPVHVYRGGFYDSTAVACRYPYFHIRSFGPCPHYSYWEYRFDFTKRPVNNELRKKVLELRGKRENYYFESLSGDANAQYFLASYYANGISMPMDLSKAYAWFKISADNGNIVSQRKLEDLIERAPQEVIDEGENQVPLLYERIASFREDIEEPALSDETKDTAFFNQENASY